MGMFWVFFDPNKELISFKLTTEEAQFVIQRLKTKYTNTYLIWRTGWTKWQKMNEFLRCTENPFVNTYNSLSLHNDANDGQTLKLVMNFVSHELALKIQSTVTEINTSIVEVKDLVKKSKKQFDGDDVTHEVTVTKSSSNFNFSSLRNSTAFLKRNTEDKFKIELLLVHPMGYIFRTTAKDISLTGTYNERIIPHQFHSCKFEVIIINNLCGDNCVASDPELKQIKLKCKVVNHDGDLYIEYERPNEDQKRNLRKILNSYRELFLSLTAA